MTSEQSGAMGVEPGPRHWSSLVWGLPLLLVIVAHWGSSPTYRDGDYAQYLLHAKALSEGRPYGDTGYLHSDFAPWVGPRAYPPGLPLVLWGIFETFGPNDFVIKIVMAVFFAGFILLAASYFGSIARPFGYGVILFCSFSRPLALASSAVNSDIAFAAIVWALVLAYERPGPFSPWRVIGITCLALAALTFRLAALALLPGMLLFAVANRSRLGLAPLLPPAIILGAMAAAALALPGLSSALLVQDIDLAYVVGGVLGRLSYFRLPVFQSHLYPFHTSLLNAAYHVISFALMLLGLVSFLRGHWSRFITSFAVSYVAFLSVVPASSSRYLWPLVPLFVFGFLNGIRLLIGYVTPRRIRKPAAALAVALPIALFTAVNHTLYLPAPPSLVRNPASQELFAYLAGVAAREEVRVAFVKPRVLSWETGIPAMQTFFGDPEQIEAEIRRLGVTHVVLGDLGVNPTNDEIWRRLVARDASLFEREYGNEAFEVFRFHRDDRQPSPSQGGVEPAPERRIPLVGGRRFAPSPSSYIIGAVRVGGYACPSRDMDPALRGAVAGPEPRMGGFRSVFGASATPRRDAPVSTGCSLFSFLFSAPTLENGRARGRGVHLDLARNGGGSELTGASQRLLLPAPRSSQFHSRQ